MSLDFVTIDFETANFARASACSVGVARVVNGELQDRDEWFIDPPGGAYFTNSFIHGITENDVVGAPSWEDSLDKLSEFSRGLPLVAYSGFDRGVYNAANTATGFSDRGFEWRNALSLTRRRLAPPDHSLSDYKLPTVANYLGVPDFDHHSAAADAEACAAIVLKLAAFDGCTDLNTLWPIPAGEKRTRIYVPKSELPKANLEADSNHPLYDQSICFTGKLDSFTQSEAERIAVDFGARVEKNVTKRTTLVVVGQFDPAHLRAGAKLSSKAQKAATLAAEGQPVEIVDEAAFLAFINLDLADY